MSAVKTTTKKPLARDTDDSGRDDLHAGDHEIEWSASRPWRWTAGSGIALVVLATMHVVAQHFIAHGTGGLRTYHQVLQYLSNPVFVVVECAFLLALTVHAMLGLRSILLDFDLGPRTRRHLSKLLWALGTVTFCYGTAVVLILASR